MRTAREQQSAVRGCVLGLILGDAIGASSASSPASPANASSPASPASASSPASPANASSPASSASQMVLADGMLPATSAGQLACFTIDGIIRAHIRSTHRGICHPPSVVWNSYQCWAAIQGVSGVGQKLGNGWLTQVPALAARRGSAPATVTALQGKRMGQLDHPAGGSTGAHALTRTLPVGLINIWSSEPGRMAAEIAATTHAVEAAHTAAIGATIIAKVANGHGIEDAVRQARQDCLSFMDKRSEPPIEPALAAGRSQPRQAAVLARLAPDARAASALAGAIYVALSFPDPTHIRDALLFAASAGDGGHVAAVTGALSGVAHGVDALPVDWVSRLELAWVADALARDLMTEFVDKPSGDSYRPPLDPHWVVRYPG